MGLNDNFLIIICVLMPAIYCGKLTEFFLLQHRLLDLLRYRNTRLSHSPWLYGITMPHGNYSLTVPRGNRAWNSVYPKKISTFVESAQSPLNVTSPVIYRPPPNTSSTSTRPRPQENLLFYQRPMYKRYDDYPVKATVEVLVFIDNSIFRKYRRENDFDIEKTKAKIKQYYRILFAMVNQRFENIADRVISVRVHICDILMAETRREAQWIEYLSTWSEAANNCFINASRALKRFQKELRNNKSLPKYDHAVLVSSCLLSKRKRQVEGLAYTGKMCKVRAGRSVSIVHDMGDFQAAGVISHEIGHSLGIDHDGSPENRDCPAARNYVMAPQFSQNASVATNTFYFSSCSIRQMKKFLHSSQAACLFNTPVVNQNHDMNKDPPGVMFDVDQQCQNAFGPYSSFCDWSGPAARSTMCSRMWCKSPDEQNTSCMRHSRLMALPGTPCGYRQFCHLGQCVYSSSFMSPFFNNMFSNRIGTRTTASCSRGDVKPAFCRRVIKASPYMNPCVMTPRLLKYCCDSCMTNAVSLYRW